MNSGLYTSNTDEWETPQELFDSLNKQYSFTLDVSANDENKKCNKYFTKEEDGLLQDWSKDTCWMNPPYGREIAKWVKKAFESNTTVVCLLPARTDTKWFHDYIYNKAQVKFIRGRLKFGGAKWNAPFPSMIAVFSPTQ
jgi:site-specific DNA-methyltransferase (adenine-specific)